ncbi:MAG TPA: serine/threonine protein kinase [Desulfobulbus sp.]|nr:serine/threonine protein kinase [Desulfobulbus sp.]
MKRVAVNSDELKKQQCAFEDLSPEVILSAVENGLGMYVSNLCRPMNSYINRVFELADEDGEGLIAKFYRPSRWSRQALQEEHDYLLELERAEVPVIAPLSLADGTTLGKTGSVYFAVFPKKWGRNVDEYTDDQWLELGHLLGRVHAVGAGGSAQARLTMHPQESTRSQVRFLLEHGNIPPELQPGFQEQATAVIDQATPLFTDMELIRLHGDCHNANLIYRPDESFYIIDFDDMVIGPPVQDFWMLLPDAPEKSLVEIDIFLEGYRTFRDFDIGSLRLIEPLRAMRFIHYMAWCAHQVLEDGSSVIMPDFGTREYWQREIDDLGDQLQRISKQSTEYLLM